MQNYLSKESSRLESTESQDEYKELLFKNNNLTEEIEKLKKNFSNEKFELESNLKKTEYDLEKLKLSLKSSNELLDVYKSINKEKENFKIKEIIEKLKLKNFELENLNQILKTENLELNTELDNLKQNFEKNKNTEANTKNINETEISIKENRIKDLKNNFNSVYSTNQNSSCTNGNYLNQISNDTIKSTYTKLENKNNENFFISELKDEENKTKIDENLENINFSNRNNEKNLSNYEIQRNFINSNQENEEKENTQNLNNLSINLNDEENLDNDSDSIKSGFTFTNKTSEEIKEFFLKVKKEKQDIYKNAVNMLTEKEIEVLELKKEIDDLRYLNQNFDDEFNIVKETIKRKFNITVEKIQDLEFFFLYNHNISDENETEENSVTSIGIKENKNFSSEKKENEKNNIFDELYLIKKFKSTKNFQNNSENYFNEENSKDCNLFEKEKNGLKNYTEILEKKLFDTKTDSENIIYKLKDEIQNLESEKYLFIQELEHFTSNKKNLVNDIEYYSSSVRNLVDQKEKLEDNFKNKIDYLRAENKNLEKTNSKFIEQINILEKEKKDHKEKEINKFLELKKKFSLEKENLESKFLESSKRFSEINKEKELIKKENENLRVALERNKIQIEDLISLNIKIKKENDDLNNTYKSYIEKIKIDFCEKIEKFDNKLKNYNFLKEKNKNKKNNYKENEISNIQVDKLNKMRTKSMVEHHMNILKNELLNKEILENNDYNYSNNSNVLNLEKKNNIKENFNNQNKINKFSIFNNEKIILSDIITENYNIKNLDNYQSYKYKNKDLDILKEKETELFQIDEIQNNKLSTFLNFIDYNSEDENNENKNLDETTKIPLNLAMEPDQNEQTEKNKKNESFTKNNSLKYAKRKISLRNINNDNIKKKLKPRFSKIGTISILNFKNDKTNTKNNHTKDKLRQKINFNLMKKLNEENSKDLEEKLSEFEKKGLFQPEPNIDDILLISDLKEKNIILANEKKYLLNQIEFLKGDLMNLDQCKNEYILRLKIDLEKTEEIAVFAKFSKCQIVFEKESEILKLKNYIRKLKLTIQALEKNNQMFAENLENFTIKFFNQKKIK